MNSKHKPFHLALETWYRAHGRHDLPWRKTNDPYAVYISEVMLQQTQVKTVLERFYDPFMRRFPSLDALANASEQEVLKHWQGLGYYSRARNLYKAAQICAPRLPDNAEGLLALPGIGQNTAHAILAFGFRKPYAVMEANVKRVLCRIFALESPTAATLWEKAALLLNEEAPFDYNQAMMDLGAMICTSKSPACLACPAAKICSGKKNPTAYPAPKISKAVPTRAKRIVVLQDEAGKLFCTPRNTQFLGGLYGFLEVDSSQKNLVFQGKKYPTTLRNSIGVLTQIYSHFRLEASVHRLKIMGIQNGPEWMSPQELHTLPLSKADEKALALYLAAKG